jgi:predicted alpha/beta-fold hydrolase
MQSLHAVQTQPLAGHFWTLAGYLKDQVRTPRAPASVPFEGRVHDPRTGELRLTGRLSETGGDRLLVVLHGIAGSCESGYAVRAAIAAERAGMSCLRLNLRGADRSGEDFFHAGLTDDLHAVLASAALSGYRSLHVLGYSLGGHVAMRAATETAEARLESVAAICSPLDLSACASAFDRPASWGYRRRIVAELIRTYERVVARRTALGAPEIGLTPVDRVRRARSLREFDGLTVVPRFGFRDAEDYYRSMSVGPMLDLIKVRALLVVGASDPLVPLATLAPYLETAPETLSVALLERGGHVGFPSETTLGLDAPLGIEAQAIAWLGDAEAGSSARLRPLRYHVRD